MPGKEVPDTSAALAGALDIIAEQWSDDPPTRLWLAQQARSRGRVVSQLKRGKKDEENKFEAYVDHREPAAKIPSHRLLAMLRGRIGRAFARWRRIRGSRS